MSPDRTSATGRPRTENDETDAADAAYLRALGELTRHHAHALRARVGTVALQLDLARELLGADAAADRERARDQVVRARTNLRELVDALEAFFALTRPPVDEPAADLTAVLRAIEAALAPVARDRMVELDVRLPAGQVLVEARPGELRDRLLVDALRALETLPPGGRLEASVTGAGDRTTVSIATRRPAAGGADAAGIAAIPGTSNEPRDEDSPLVLTVRTHPASR